MSKMDEDQNPKTKQKLPANRRSKDLLNLPDEEEDSWVLQDDASSNLDTIFNPRSPRINISDERGSSSPGGGIKPVDDLTERWDESGIEYSVLLKTAIRRRGEGVKETERWVRLEEVVDGKGGGDRDEEASSCTSSFLMGLKLDNYQEILDAWSDKGPFWLGASHRGPSSQLVPDQDLSPPELWTMWKVPEVIPEDSTWRRREESVMRYKEKRQSRLFSKRIRYEVRRVNAQTRPRNKGRFVKENG